MNYKVIILNAIIFHPDQELILIKEQKNILSFLNQEKIFFYPYYPVYCFFESKKLNELTPKELRNEISNIKILSPELTDENLFFPVSITLKDSSIQKEKIIIGIRTNTKYTEQKLINQTFCMECKIFKIATIKKIGFSTEIWDDIWVKLSKK